MRGATEHWLQEPMTTGSATVALDAFEAIASTGGGERGGIEGSSSAFDLASKYLPLVYQQPPSSNSASGSGVGSGSGSSVGHTNTTVLEQPLDFSTLGPK